MTRMPVLVLVWFCLLGASCAAATDAVELENSSTCPGSCDLTTVEPVCGSDGLTYQTSCLAICQGISVSKTGPCTARAASTFAPASAIGASSVEGTAVDAATMQRFANEGFRFIGQGKSEPAKPVEFKFSPGRRRGSKPTLTSTATRFVYATGHMYATATAESQLTQMLKSMGAAGRPEDMATLAFDPSATPRPAPRNASLAGAATIEESGNSTMGAESGNATMTMDVATSDSVTDVLSSLGRRLRQFLDGQAVFGPDGRTRVTPTTSYPWRAVGWLSATGSGCSGAMVTATSVLTAAHCLHGGPGRNWNSNIQFHPGADDGARPYGSHGSVWATLYSHWITNGCNDAVPCKWDSFHWDMGVVRLATAIGSSTGWFGMSISDTFNIQATTAGYPTNNFFNQDGTRYPHAVNGPYPSMWRVSCPLSDSNPGDFIISTSQCDTARGQSGSAIWETSTNSIRGVNSYESGSHNGFCQLTTQKFWDVLNWIGGSYTAWNDAGERDGYKSIYLDRHDLSFCSNLQALREFKLEMQYRGWPNTALMRVTYQCDGFRRFTGAAAIRYTTPANDWGNGNTIFFDRHNIQCPPNQALRRWKLFRPSGTQIAFEFFCAPVTSFSTCQDLATPWSDNGNGQVNFLDRHTVSCPAGAVLTRWQLNTNNPARQYRVAYRCCN